MAIVNEGSSSRSSEFKSVVDCHCKQHSVNSLYGMLIAHSEGGVYNNPNDTDIWNPLPTCARNGCGKTSPRGAARMLQGAARFSALARMPGACPQIAGVVIDDFWSNYSPEPPPKPTANCPSCPTSHPHGYGSYTAGYYCCAWPLISNHYIKPGEGGNRRAIPGQVAAASGRGRRGATRRISAAPTTRPMPRRARCTTPWSACSR